MAVYDEKTAGPYGSIVTFHGKKGRINHYDGTYDIPLIYDEVEEIIEAITINGGTVILPGFDLVLVKLGDKWGCYCYIEAIRLSMDYREDRINAEKYIKKCNVKPEYDEIKQFFAESDLEGTFEDYYDGTATVDKSRIVLLVRLEGKQGVLDPYENKFIAATVFDEVIKCVMLQDGNYNIYGKIEGKNIMYDGEFYFEMREVDIKPPKEYSLLLAKKRIKSHLPEELPF